MNKAISSTFVGLFIFSGGMLLIEPTPVVAHQSVIESNTPFYEGVIVWKDPERGVFLVISKDGSRKFLISYNVIKNKQLLKTGQRVRFSLSDEEGVIKIFSVEPPF